MPYLANRPLCVQGARLSSLAFNQRSVVDSLSPSRSRDIDKNCILTSTLFLTLHDCDSSNRRRGRVYPFNREQTELESMAWELIEICQVLEVVVLTRLHDAVRFPELLTLEHRPDRRVIRDGIDPRHLDALVQQPICRFASHADVIGKIFFAVLDLSRSGMDQNDVQRLQRVVNLRQRLLHVVDLMPAPLGK